MNPNDEEGIDREAWRRRLGGAGEPAPITELRIRTAARRAVTPRIGHWWLPASLAASLVLAVFVVQWQLEDYGRAPMVRESDTVRQEMPAQAPVYVEAPPPQETMSLPMIAAPPPMADLPATEAEAPLRREKTREAEADSPRSNYSFAPPPRVDQAVTTAAESAADAAAGAAAPAAPAAEQEAAPADDEVDSMMVTGSHIHKQRSDARLRTPEQWYADIEALRKAGRDAEADEELELLEEAYPGWLERQQSAKP